MQYEKVKEIHLGKWLKNANFLRITEISKPETIYVVGMQSCKKAAIKRALSFANVQ